MPLYKKFILLVSFISLLLTTGRAQTSVDSMLMKYPFLKLDSNKIYNHGELLFSFYEKLDELKSGKRKTISIVQIGDSHIQADFFSGKMRESFQKDFGNAGRGFIFPYRVAKTNEPASYKTFSSQTWKSKRNVFPEKELPIGIAGITLSSDDPNASIHFSLNKKNLIDYRFNKLTVFHDKGLGSYDLTICDEFNCQIKTIRADSVTTNNFISSIRFEKLMSEFTIKCTSSDTSTSKCMRIYGMSLENGENGILYHSIGVNGAEYRFYNYSEYFTQQLSLLQPDLIIVSMGTNEGFYNGFDKNLFYGQVDTFITTLKKEMSLCPILLTTPADSFRKSKKGKTKNLDMLAAKNTLIDYSKKNQLAYWDLYEIMGGFGSMGKWHTAGLAAKDKLHFSKKGYELQGALFYEAIWRDYKLFELLKNSSKKK